MSISSIGAALESLDIKMDPAHLVPGVYDSFQSELLSMLQSLDTGEDYKSPFFPRGVDPHSGAFQIVQTMTFTTYEQIISHCFKSIEMMNKWCEEAGKIGIG